MTRSTLRPYLGLGGQLSWQSSAQRSSHPGLLWCCALIKPRARECMPAGPPASWTASLTQLVTTASGYYTFMYMKACIHSPRPTQRANMQTAELNSSYLLPQGHISCSKNCSRSPAGKEDRMKSKFLNECIYTIQRLQTLNN